MMPNISECAKLIWESNKKSRSLIGKDGKGENSIGSGKPQTICIWVNLEISKLVH